jgi:hypothetical protein
MHSKPFLLDGSKPAKGVLVVRWIDQCPDCRFARRATAEVGIRHEDARSAKRFAIEDKSGILSSVGGESPAMEEKSRESRRSGFAQEFGGDDLVSVDIRFIEGSGDGREGSEWFHAPSVRYTP